MFWWPELMKVFNKDGAVMENGDSINSDYSETNGMMIIPFPDDSNKYYLFHLLHISFQSKLYYSVIDMSYNNGLGKVTSKNIPLPISANDSLCEKLAAVKHGNGNDWWLLCHSYGNDHFYEFLISDSGISAPILRTAGSCLCLGDLNIIGEMCFSKDGCKLLNVTTSLADVLSFDRCAGELSSLIELNTSINPDYPFYYGCSFSPSGRFIYVSNFQDWMATNNNRLYQLDLQAPDILASKYMVYEGPSGNNYAGIGQHQLGPDDKIYISFAHSLPYYPTNADSTNLRVSIIDYPDSAGLTCNFIPFTFYLNGRMMGGGLPNMPNYNLGAIEENGCDSLENEIASLSSNFHFDLFPNPALSQLTLYSNFNGAKSLIIQNIFGQIVFSKKFSLTEAVIDVSELPAGVYLVTVKSSEGVFSKKVVKE